MAKPGNRPHRVTLCRWAKPNSGVRDESTREGVGGSVRLFAFSWQDLAVLLGVKSETAQKLAADGAFDPQDLESIAAFWLRRRAMPH